MGQGGCTREAVNNRSNSAGWARLLLTTGATLLDGPGRLY